MMYTDTVQTFVILGGAFILMGYGKGLSQWARGMEVLGLSNPRSANWDISSTCVLESTMARTLVPLTALQLSMRWAATQDFLTNTWGQ